MNIHTKSRMLVLVLLGLVLYGCEVPITLIERVVEARSSADIVEDNRIVLDVNGIMADLETLKASTDIYEQRLLVVGLFDDEALYEEFKTRVEAVEGVKVLYWHATYMSEEEQEKVKLLNWTDVMALDAKVGINLIGTGGVADVNFRVAADPFRTIYLLGRARSQPELDKALQVVRETEGIERIINYVEVRP
ncbi:MAG: BON domain-containing protein [Proteobacteria bacterium]|nr:BON domain-containing protein [Pseudomonadota bacterium]